MRLTDITMKRLSLYLFLILFTLQTPSWADDIRDFQIEGISIGDSLLDYFSEDKLKQDIVITPNIKDSDYIMSCFDDYGNTYSRTCFFYKKNSIKKKVEGIQGQTKYNKSAFKNCRNKQIEIDDDLSSLFTNLDKNDWGKLKLLGLKDIDPDAYYHPITYTFNDNSRAQIGCYQILDKTRLKVIVYNSELRKVISK